jgi:hypothetical protein
MDPDFYSDIPNGARDADALDRALDDFVRGRRRRAKRLDSNLGATVDRLFTLAQVGGTTGVMPSRPRRKLLPWPMRQIVSVTSTIAAVIILAIGINATFPQFRDQSSGLATSIPTTDAEDDQLAVEPLTPADCNVEPRTREEVIAILSQAPSIDASLADRETPPVPAGAEVEAEIQGTIRAWQACWRFGDLWATYALESEQFIRRTVYGSDQIDIAYSEAALGELLQGAERAYERRHLLGDSVDGSRHLLVPGSAVLSENGTIAHAELERYDQTGPVADTTISAVFVLENGTWKLWIIFGPPIDTQINQ